MKLGSILENQTLEKRIAITPDIAKKYISLGFDLSLVKNYGFHLGFTDEEYKDSGVNILNEEKEIINNFEVLIQMGLPGQEKLSHFRENQTLIGSLNVFSNKQKLNELKLKKNKLFFIRVAA